jgi:hypothetical protein
VVGEATHELDIGYALGLETRSEYEIKKAMKEESLGSDFNKNAGRNLAAKYE